MKYVNDTYGHEAGDTLIRNVADILVKSTRKTDVISRSGGDEYIVVCPNTDVERTQPIVDRIRELEAETAITYSNKDGKTESIPVRMVGVADSGEFPPEGSWAKPIIENLWMILQDPQEISLGSKPYSPPLLRNLNHFCRPLTWLCG